MNTFLILLTTSCTLVGQSYVIDENSSIPREVLQEQADNLIISVISGLEGEEEAEIVRYLLRLQRSLGETGEGDAWQTQVEVARAEVMNVVNNFFYERLNALPSIREYIANFQH